MMTLIARFQVDGYEPRQVTGLDADWFGLMTFAKTFTDGITGHATTLFMAAAARKDPGRTWPPNGSPGAPTAGRRAR
jgi:hypothetical protein